MRDGYVIPMRSWTRSGFLISKDGYILTNAHVDDELKDISIYFGNGMELVGELVKKDVIHDVALVQVGLSRAKAIPIMLDIGQKQEKLCLQ